MIYIGLVLVQELFQDWLQEDSHNFFWDEELEGRLPYFTAAQQESRA